MLKDAFGTFSVVHGVLLAIAAIGLFKFWARTRFWLPKYIHVLAGIGLAVGWWSLSVAPTDAPVNKYGPIGRLLFALIVPAIVYFFFIVYGGQRAAFDRSSSAPVPCPFCQEPVLTLLPQKTEGTTAAARFAEPQCPHCGHALT